MVGKMIVNKYYTSYPNICEGRCLFMVYMFRSQCNSCLNENKKAPPTPKHRAHILNFPPTLGIPTIRLRNIQSPFP